MEELKKNQSQMKSAINEIINTLDTMRSRMKKQRNKLMT